MQRRLGVSPRKELDVTPYADKRLVLTSAPFPTRIEAVEAAAANKHLPQCEYVYVTEDNRVVGIYRYYDVTPDKPVGKGQKRVIVPK